MRDVEDVRTETREGPVDATRDALRGPVRNSGDAVAELRREDEGGAAAGEVPPDPLLGEAVAGRGVDEGEAEVERAVEEPPGLGVVEGTVPDVARAEAEGRHGEPRRAEGTELAVHGVSAP